jgi:hypothetical protein
MAPRKYTMVDVTTDGSNVQRYREKLKSKYPPGSLSPKGYSDDTRMKNMFPNSPLYQTGSDVWDDNAIIDNFKSYETAVISESFDFNNDTNAAYLGFNHPQAPEFGMEKMNKPIPDMLNSNDKPYYGHPNIQVTGINPLEESRTVVTGGLLRDRNIIDGGFGTKNALKNYPTSEVRTSIGTFFSNVYSSDNVTEQVNSKINSMGNSTMSGSVNGAVKDENLSKDVNNYKYLSNS